MSETASVPSSTVPTPRRAWRGPAAAALLALGFALLLLLHDPRAFWHDDCQSGIVPAFVEIARAYDHGEFPLLTAHSWYCGNLAGEFQLNTFSLPGTLAMLVATHLGLSMPGIAAAYVIPHLMLLASGAFALARRRGLTADLAMLVAVAATLNGWTIGWAASDWVSLLTSFAWLPWAWLALEGALDPTRGIRRCIWPALALYALLAAGWPLTDVMMALVTLVIAIRDLLAQRNLRRLWPLAAAWGLGLALVAPAVLLLYAHVHESVRVRSALGPSFEWIIPPAGYVGLIYPAFASLWHVYDRHQHHLPIEMANGLVPTAGLVAGLALRGRPLLRCAGWELGLLVLLVVASMLPSVGIFRWSFRWLPLIHLLMALIGAEAIQLLRKARTEPGAFARWPALGRPGLWALALVLPVWLLASEPVAVAGLGTGLVALAIGWAWLESGMPAVARWGPAGVALLALLWTYWVIPTGLETPRWHFSEAMRAPAPFNPHVRYLALAQADDYFSAHAQQDPEVGLLIRPGTTFFLAGLEFVNGYSPLGPRGLADYFKFELNGFMDLPVSRWVLTHETASNGLLQLMGVDGLVIGRDLVPAIGPLASHGWVTRRSSSDGALLERTGQPSPRVRALPAVRYVAGYDQAIAALRSHEAGPVPLVLEADKRDPAGSIRAYAPCDVRLVEDGRQRKQADVVARSQTQPSLVAFATAWFPGYRAYLDGRELPVRVLDEIMPAVEIPPGARGRLTLVYRPAGLLWGGGLSLAALVALAALWLLGRKRQAPVQADAAQHAA